MALTSGFQFFDPYEPTKYGWNQAWDFNGSPLQGEMAQNNTDASYGAWLAGQGMLGLDNQSDFGRSLKSRFEQGYGAAQLTNPNLTWLDYLKKYNGSLGHLMAGVDPASRGLIPSRTVRDARWLPRTF